MYFDILVRNKYMPISSVYQVLRLWTYIDIIYHNYVVEAAIEVLEIKLLWHLLYGIKS